MKGANSEQRSAVSGQPGAPLNAQLPNAQPPVRGEFVMTVGEGRIAVHVGNLNAGELQWLGEVVSLMCDPAKAQQWADFKTKARLLAYVQGHAEVVTATGIVRTITAAANARLQAQALAHLN